MKWPVSIIACALVIISKFPLPSSHNPTGGKPTNNGLAGRDEQWWVALPSQVKQLHEVVTASQSRTSTIAQRNGTDNGGAACMGWVGSGRFRWVWLMRVINAARRADSSYS